MKITPSEFLKALELWKKQAETIIKEGKLVIHYEEDGNEWNFEIGWDDILLDMEEFARSTTILLEISEEAKQRAVHTMKLK